MPGSQSVQAQLPAATAYVPTYRADLGSRGNRGHRRLNSGEDADAEETAADTTETAAESASQLAERRAVAERETAAAARAVEDLRRRYDALGLELIQAEKALASAREVEAEIGQV